MLNRSRNVRCHVGILDKFHDPLTTNWLFWMSGTHAALFFKVHKWFSDLINCIIYEIETICIPWCKYYTSYLLWMGIKWPSNDYYMIRVNVNMIYILNTSFYFLVNQCHINCHYLNWRLKSCYEEPIIKQYSGVWKSSLK